MIVPLKAAAGRKSRLKGRLTVAERCDLTDRMFAHVVKAIGDCPVVGRIVVLAPAAPVRWAGGLLIDRGRGLNHELAAAERSLGRYPLAVIHADLPLLTADDVAGLLASADAWGSAIAPDRHGTGTNALALHSARSFSFCFGPGSFARHAGQLPGARVVQRPGFCFDLDTHEDFELALEAGVAAVSERLYTYEPAY